jgi:hypothetical protein
MKFFGLFRKSTDASENEPTESSAAEVPENSHPPLALPSPTLTPDQLRRLLFDAVASGDERRLESLCQEHKEAILAHGEGWLEVPEAFRASPETYEWYGNGLRAIAEFCAERFGRSERIDHFEHPPAAADRSN